MGSWKTSATSAAALGVFFGGTAAFADVTAADVWSNWKGYMESSGYGVEAAESQDGNTLSIDSLTMSIEIPDEDVTLALTMEGMAFTDNGDGTVSVSLPPVMPIRIKVTGDDADAADITVNYETTGLSMNVSGDPDNMTYTYSAAELAIRLAELVVEGEALDLGTIEMTMADVAGTTAMTTGNLRSSEQMITTGAVAYNVDISEPGGSGTFVLRGGVDSLDMTGSASLPMDMDPNDMARMLKEGFAVDVMFSYENGSTEFNFQEHGDTVQGASSSASGGLEVVMDETHLVYAGGADQMNLSMAGGDIPFPVELAMEEFGFDFEIPVSSGDDPQDFGFAVTLGGFTMSDMIWGIVDPAGQLPRDPATIAVDLAGSAKIFVDLMDPEQMAQVDSGAMMPGELQSLNINGLTLSAAGAALTGAGGFTFDNTDMATFGGMPAPEGAVDLQLVGGNGLIDKLVGMGLLPEEQATGARMMMGLFAVPGDAPDTLNSKIEVKSDGQILANGQRIQ